MAVSAETAAVLEATLPSYLKPDLDIVMARLPPSQWSSRHLDEPVYIDGEQIRLLNRFYSPEPVDADLAGLTERQRQVLASLYSWHHDGFVRERWMAGLRGDEPWLPLFMLRLVGDYVEPIWERALAEIDAIPRERYLAFARENPAFMSATRDRIVSYHREVGRLRRDFIDNPAYRFMAELGLWQRPQARRCIGQAKKLREGQAR
jgi:hypothetical protein